MWDENPSLIEDPSPGTPEDALTPLVLIHDGGGTIFSYHCIDPPLDRRVLGIANPHFHSGGSWLPGGLPEMARHYICLLRDALGAAAGKRWARQRILLGGWSMGGLVALEMARLLHGDAGFEVAGILMVDSVCPRAFLQKLDPGGPLVRPVPQSQVFATTTKQDVRDKVNRCFDEAFLLIGQWQMPTWEDGGAPPPPPVVLLKSSDRVPVADGCVVRVDLGRDDPTMCWDRYRKDFVRRVIEIPGHHYNAFADHNIESTSAAMREALESLDIMASSSS